MLLALTAAISMGILAHAYGRKRPGTSFRVLARDDVNLLVLACAAEFMFCAVLGRLGEVHILLPFAGLLALIATNALGRYGEDSGLPLRVVPSESADSEGKLQREWVARS